MTQIDLVAACERRDEGIERVRRSTGDEWCVEAARFIAMFAGAIAQGEAFLIEDVALRWSCEGRRPPTTAKAWGAAVRLASRPNTLNGGKAWIVQTGQTSNRTKNCCHKPLWRRA